MSTKVWSSSLRTVFVFSKSLCSGVFKKFSMWVLATMDCLRSLYNIIGIRFFMMALIKIWTLILYVLRRNLKKVWRELHKSSNKVKIKADNLPCLLMLCTRCNLYGSKLFTCTNISPSCQSDAYFCELNIKFALNLLYSLMWPIDSYGVRVIEFAAILFEFDYYLNFTFGKLITRCFVRQTRKLKG